LRWSIDRTRLS